MPRSKRNRIVTLSKVEKKGKELTVKTYTNVQTCVGQYSYLYVFAVDNMRNTYLKDVRAQLSDSRLFFGKTKVMGKALGSTPATAAASGTHKLAPFMHGAVGLLFTPREPKQLHEFVDAFRPADYARAGTLATRTFVIPQGLLHSRAGEIPEEEDVPVSAGQEPNLRALGVPTRLVKGKIEVDADHRVCTEGDVLDSSQTALLKMFGVATAEFHIELKACWVAATGEILDLRSDESKNTRLDLLGTGEDNMALEGLESEDEISESN